VHTPLRIAAPALEDYIDAEPSGDRFLRTSPELHMKRLLAAGYERIFQLGPCFRRGERGRVHLPEFAMLEWYRLNADYRDVLNETVALVRHAFAVAAGRPVCRWRGCEVDVSEPWEEITVEDAFGRYAGRNVDDAVDSGEFEQVLVEKIEPQLGQGRPTVLLDYPVACSGLSRRKPDNPERVERWELYIAGLELANACSELVDCEEQRQRFEACAALREIEGREVYAPDQAFMAALREGMPPAAGVALGVDRLIMAISGADPIADAVAFPE